jgi:hypothetical protein
VELILNGYQSIMGFSCVLIVQEFTEALVFKLALSGL